MNRDYLFVYGTLRSKTKHPMSELLATGASFTGAATFRGRLFLIGDYPGAVPSADPHHIVYGDLYLLDHAESLLARLDQYEESGVGFPGDREYVRRKEEVRLEGGKTLKAWIYLYNLPVKDLTIIESGDFLNRLKKK